MPAIALTAFNREEDRRAALDAGFDAHCGKPVRPLEIVRQIALLARKKTACAAWSPERPGVRSDRAAPSGGGPGERRHGGLESQVRPRQ